MCFAKRNLALLILTLCAPTLAPAQTVRVTATDPAPASSLNLGDTLYAQIHYVSAEPVRFAARGLRSGEALAAGLRTNPAPPYPAGEGEALVWLQYVEPTRIDGLRIVSYDQRWQPLAETTLPLEIEWRPAAQPAPRPPAAWAARLSAAQQQMVRDTPDTDTATGFGWGLLFMLSAWATPGYFVLQIWAYRRWEGRGRGLALLPLLFTIPIFIYTVLGLVLGSNLWPLVMLFTYPWAFLYLAVLMGARRMAAAGGPATRRNRTV